MENSASWHGNVGLQYMWLKRLEICMPVQAVNLRVVDSVSSSSKEMERVPCVIDTHMLQI